MSRSESTIVIVDDDLLAIRPFTRELSVSGHDVKCFQDADTCAEFAATRKRCDLFVLDVMLAVSPDSTRFDETSTDDFMMTGVALARLIRKHRKTTPIIFFTMASLRLHLSRILEQGSRIPNCGMLRKDFSSTKEFRDTLEYIIANGVDAAIETGRVPSTNNPDDSFAFPTNVTLVIQKDTEMDPTTVATVLSSINTGVGILDKVAGPIMRFIKGDREPESPRDYHYRITTDESGIKVKDGDRVIQTITGKELERLPDDIATHIRTYEQALERKYRVWQAVYPQRNSSADAMANAKVDEQIRDLVLDMKSDLEGIVQFLQSLNVVLDDHYIIFRDVIGNYK